MTKKRYYRTNTNIYDNITNTPYYSIRDIKKEEYNVLFIVSGKNTSKNIIDLLNEQEERINELELENAKHIGDGEWDIRDITYGHGKFRLEEWGERYHQFYDGDKPLEDETVVSLLFENDKLKQQIETKNQQIKELETEQNQVQKVLTDYFNRYTKMAVELRGDKYGNGVCHNVTEVIMEIADKLDINIIDDGDDGNERRSTI